LQHELVREALRLTGVVSQIEIGTLGDIPSTGSGLGSSSTVTVGVLNALHAYKNEIHSHEQLARQACQIEIEKLCKPVGKQDQYIVSFGGIRFIRFLSDDNVTVETVELSDSERRRFNQQLLLFYTNTGRQSESILREQNMRIESKRTVLREMCAMAYQGRSLLEIGDFDTFGRLMDESWKLKKTLASKISNPEIDEIYDKAKKAGALGGKITGAGGGGFLLLYCPREKQYQLRNTLSSLQELPFHLELDGTKVIFNYRNSI
jgi:D-glycero-alpha-D-manno-heptose-7-phosphate kinase